MISNRRLGLFIGAVVAMAVPAAAQLYPQGSQVISYFPQIADGGPSGARWVTTMTFVNPHGLSTAVAIASFYDDNGQPLSLDFGNGPASSVKFNVAPQGTVTLTSKAASASTVSGWAVVASTLPLEGVVQYTLTAGGAPKQSISAEATPASTEFRSPATASTGIAIANPYVVPITATISALDTGGNSAGQASVSIPALGHHAFNLAQLLPALPPDFLGSVVIHSPGGAELIALTVSVNGAALSNYPPSGLNWPISQTEDIYKVWSEVASVAIATYNFSTLPRLVIDNGPVSLNAYADSKQSAVHVTMNVAELISDSESELAFVLGHALGHVIQAQGGQLLVPGDAEADADQWAILLNLAGGYDPYGASGALGKLVTATGVAGLMSPTFDNLSAPAGIRTSLNTRLAAVFQNMQAICSYSNDFNSLCQSYRQGVHPNFPGSAPLMVRTPKLPTR